MPRRPNTPCRLFVYLARDAPRAVVLRRGPADWARLSLWHTDTDRVEHGQWLKGRVYERRSDVSHDGSLFAAFVRQSGGRSDHPRAADTWVALSRPPYFAALSVWFVGGTYYTGACFPRPGELWLGFTENATPDIGRLPPRLRIAAPRDVPYVDDSSEWTERTVHFNRLLRDGWSLHDRDMHTSLWSHPSPDEQYTLRMLHRFDRFTKFGGPYHVEYAVQCAGGAEQALGTATWADWDHRGRLAIAQDGVLSTWTVHAGYETIEDFNDQRPDPQPAPDWATRW